MPRSEHFFKNGTVVVIHETYILGSYEHVYISCQYCRMVNSYHSVHASHISMARSAGTLKWHSRVVCVQVVQDHNSAAELVLMRVGAFPIRRRQ